MEKYRQDYGAGIPSKCIHFDFDKLEKNTCSRGTVKSKCIKLNGEKCLYCNEGEKQYG